MGVMKRYLEEVSCGLGFGGEINGAVLAHADRDMNGEPTFSHPDQYSWDFRTWELADAAMSLVNRDDCCGGYRHGHGTTHKNEYRDWLPMHEALQDHFSGERIIGLHTTSQASLSLANTCRWMAFDLDAHEGATDANMQPALELAARIRAIGLTPYIFDSDGKGGLHVWCVFKRPRPARQVFELAQRLSDGIECETFPKQDHVEPGRYGNWLRLPGRHYKLNHWSRLLTPQGWASADETIDAVIEMCGGSLSAIAKTKEQMMGDHTEATTTEQLTAFANRHGIVFSHKGTAGFGRECVGFTLVDAWVAHNPMSMADFTAIPNFADERLYPPGGVKDAYHKHDCLCVLAVDGNYDAASEQLLLWVTHLESLGELETARYKTGATGIQAVVSGVTAIAIRFKHRNEKGTGHGHD